MFILGQEKGSLRELGVKVEGEFRGVAKSCRRIFINVKRKASVIIRSPSLCIGAKCRM